jgi:hypothetical protein
MLCISLDPLGVFSFRGSAKFTAEIGRHLRLQWFVGKSWSRLHANPQTAGIMVSA